MRRRVAKNRSARLALIAISATCPPSPRPRVRTGGAKSKYRPWACGRTSGTLALRSICRKKRWCAPCNIQVIDLYVTLKHPSYRLICHPETSNLSTYMSPCNIQLIDLYVTLKTSQVIMSNTLTSSGPVPPRSTPSLPHRPRPCLLRCRGRAIRCC